MKKRLLSAILALAMTAACLTACGDSASTADTEKTESSSSQAQSESVADSESKTESTADIESKADSKADTSSDSDSSTTEEKQEEKEMLIKVEHLTPGGELIYTQTREYVKNDKGKILNSKFTITGDPKKSKASIKESAAKYEYDDNYKHCKYYDDKNEMSSEWFYDDNGEIIKLISYRNGRVDKTYLYEYNNNIGKKSKAVEYAGTEQDRSKVITTTYTYNDKGLIQKESIVTDRNGNKLYADIVYEYDANGNQTKIIKNYNIGTAMNSTDTFTYTYDDHNNCTKKIVETAAKGMNPSKTEYKYEYVYNGDSYEKTSFGLLPTNNQYLPGSKQTYSGNNLTEEIIYSPQESLKGNLVVMEIVKYTYGTV